MHCYYLFLISVNFSIVINFICYFQIISYLYNYFQNEVLVINQNLHKVKRSIKYSIIIEI